MSGLVTRRSALRGSAVAALGLAAGVAVARGVPASDAALIAQADAFRALREREHRAWGDLDERHADDGPEIEACRALSDELREAGDVLAEMPATTAAGLGAKAGATLTLVGSHLDTQANLMEQSDLVVSVLRDAARLGRGDGRALPPIAAASTAVLPARPTSADAKLRTMADRLQDLQAHADRHADVAGIDPADPYTVAVAEMDLGAAGMAMTPADTMAGVLLKVRTMGVPIVKDDDEAHGLALSVCRDLRRLHAVGALA